MKTRKAYIELVDLTMSDEVPSPRVENEDAETPELFPPPSKKEQKEVTRKKKRIGKVMKKVSKRISKKSPQKRPVLKKEEDLDRDLSVNSLSVSNGTKAGGLAGTDLSVNSLSSSSSLEKDKKSFISQSVSNGTKADGSSTSSPHPKKNKSDQKPTDKKIGFLGLGAMGFQIVQRLLETKHNVNIWNRTRREEFDQLIQAGAVFLPTPADVIRKCDITLSCLSGSDAVKFVVYDTQGVLGSLKGTCSKAYVELSTIDPMLSEEIAEAITGRGGKYLEAPMFGQRQDVKNGRMVVMSSGNHDLFHECSTVFAAFATSIFLGTEVGEGNKMSLALKMYAGVTSAALAESLALVRHMNMSPDLFMNMVDLVKQRAMTISSDEISMPVKHQASSLAMALSLGDSVQYPLPLAVPANAAFVRAAAKDDKMDVSSMFQTML